MKLTYRVAGTDYNLFLPIKSQENNMHKVAIVYGSTSDDGVMKGAFETLKEFGVSYESSVLSAHRQP